MLALAPIAPFTADDVFLHSLPAAGLPALPPEALIDALPCTIFDVTMPQVCVVSLPLPPAQSFPDTLHSAF